MLFFTTAILLCAVRDALCKTSESLPYCCESSLTEPYIAYKMFYHCVNCSSPFFSCRSVHCVLNCFIASDPSRRDGYVYIYIHIYIYIYIYVTNCRQYCFGLLGLISVVLMSRMGVKLKKPPQMSHTCGTSKPCQSAQTSELASVRNC